MESTIAISKLVDIMWMTENPQIVKKYIEDYLVSSLEIVYDKSYGHALKSRKECELNLRRFLDSIIGDNIRFDVDRCDSTTIRIYIEDTVLFDEEEMLYYLRLEYDTQMLIRIKKIKSLL